MRVSRLACLVLGLAACARPITSRPGTTKVAAPPDPDVVAVPETTTVQVRHYPYSPTVSVVGWTSEDAGFGLRTVLRRDGSLVHDHRLYVSAYYTPAIGTFHLAAVPPVQLERLGFSRDAYACYFGPCSPFETLGWRLPDDLLRTTRDSVEVKLYGRGGRELSFVVGRNLITAYLGTVDSVAAALRGGK